VSEIGAGGAAVDDRGTGTGTGAGTGRGTARPWLPAVVDVGVAVAAAAGSSVVLIGSDPGSIVLGSVACAGLLVRRRLPWVSLLLALPAFAWADAFVPVMVALFTLGTMPSQRRTTIVAVVVSALVHLVSVDTWDYPDFVTEDLVDAALYTAVPALLGAFLHARRSLADQLDALRASSAREREREARDALERERAVLAREMHDVVSHQVSLIAVQAGALQMVAPDDETRRAVRTIRQLSVATLDELRSMVEVLRASGGEVRDASPQPALADVPRLVAESGIDATLALDLPDDLSSAQQRALYRTVQEGLTNARKHATGAPVSITAHVEAGTVVLHVDAGTATEPLPGLPSARLGMTGLGERAELLGGTVSGVTRVDGSHRLTLQFPL
jgi:signal transduction histidine kinase